MATLTPEQNQRLKRAAQLLVDRHKGNISSAARALGKDHSWLNRVLADKSGGSLESASLIARELGESVTHLLGIEERPILLLGDRPGFQEALLGAQQVSGNRYSNAVWETVANLHMPNLPDVVEPWMILNLAQAVESMTVKQLTGSSKPPGGTGGHKTSARRIKKSAAR